LTIADCGFRIEELKVSGVPPEADQVSGKKNKKAEI
jgi:hypothetical protein